MSSKFKAIQDVNALYTFNLGGGMNRRKVKTGEIVTLIGKSTEIDTPCVSCAELLHKMTAESFYKLFTPIA